MTRTLRVTGTTHARVDRPPAAPPNGDGGIDRSFEPPFVDSVSASIIDGLHEPALLLDEELRVVWANGSFRQTFGLGREEIENRRVYAIGTGEWDMSILHRLLEDVLPDSGELRDLDIEQHSARFGDRLMVLNARRLRGLRSGRTLTLLAFQDVTERPPIDRRFECTASGRRPGAQKVPRLTRRHG